MSSLPGASLVSSPVHLPIDGWSPGPRVAACCPWGWKVGFMVGAGPLSPLLGQLPCSVLVVSDVGGLCQPPARGSRHWSVQLSPESGRGTLLQVQGRLGDKPPAGLRGASCLPWALAGASGEVSVAWASPLLRSAWTLGDGAGGPQAPSSGGAWGPHLERQQGVWEATLVHQFCPDLGFSWRHVL